jgi:hypothetical protein
MKRLLVVAACFALAAPLWADKPGPQHQNPLATNTITGTPLTIVVGDDTTMQVYNSSVIGTGQFYPPGTGPGVTTDAGVFVSIGGVVYGSSSVTSTPFTPVSMTPVTGTGTTLDPFTVVIVVDAGATGLRLTETLTYVNGADLFPISLDFSNTTNVALTWDTFIGADLYLAGNDAGFPFATPGVAAGSLAADSSCQTQLQYTIAFLGTTPANRYSANGYSQVWSEIASSNLSNTVSAGCLDDGAALQWTGATLTPGAGLRISTGVSFTGQLIPVGPTAVVPALSTKGLAALVLLLAAVGYVLARKASPGA